MIKIWKLFSRGLFVAIFSFATHELAAENLEEKLKQRLDAIRAFASGQKGAIKSPKEMAIEMQNSISELAEGIFRVGSGNWAHPSPERKAFIDRFSSTIAPYNDALMQTGFASGVSSTSSPLYDLGQQCRTLLNYTKADDALANALRTHTAGLTPEACFAYDLLFQHRLLTPVEKAEIGQKLSAEKNWETQKEWALKCSEMLIPETVPVLREMLSVPFRAEGTIGSTGVFGENESLTNYRKAIEAINSLGPLAASLSPLLKERLKEIEAALPADQRQIYAPQFRSAIDQVEGRKPLLVATAINGSGPLVAAPTTGVAAQSPSPRHETTPINGTLPPATPAALPPMPVAETPAAVVENKPPVWPWLVGIAALTVVALLVWKRRV